MFGICWCYISMALKKTRWNIMSVLRTFLTKHVNETKLHPFWEQLQRKEKYKLGFFKILTTNKSANIQQTVLFLMNQLNTNKSTMLKRPTLDVVQATIIVVYCFCFIVWVDERIQYSVDVCFQLKAQQCLNRMQDDW